MEEELFCYTSHDILDWKSRLKSNDEESVLQEESSNLTLTLKRESTNSIWRPHGDYWLSAFKGQNFVMFKMPKLITIFHHSLLPKHVHIDYPCVSLSLSSQSYNPLQKGSLLCVVGSFRMHKDYWEEKKDKMGLATIPKADDPSLNVLKAEKHLKRSLELEATKEELDFFNGKLTQDDIKGLVVRLKMLKRNMEVKGKVLKATMHESTLLVVLARRVQKFLLKLQAFCRARRPKEKKKEVIHKNSTWKLPNHKLVESSNKIEVKEEHKSSFNDSGRNMLIKGHTKKFFKENFKPP